MQNSPADMWNTGKGKWEGGWMGDWGRRRDGRRLLGWIPKPFHTHKHGQPNPYPCSLWFDNLTRVCALPPRGSKTFHSASQEKVVIYFERKIHLLTAIKSTVGTAIIETTQQHLHCGDQFFISITCLSSPVLTKLTHTAHWRALESKKNGIACTMLRRQGHLSSWVVKTEK